MSPAFQHEPMPMLSADEELRIARDYRRTQDRKLEDRLFRSQLRLVQKLARDHASHPDDLDELIQEGSLGLLVGVRKFDPERGARLSTYAAWWIRAYQLRWLLANHRLVRMGTTAAQRRIFFNVRGVRARLESAGLDADVDELARHLNVDAGTLAQTLGRMEQRESSLDARVEGERSPRVERLIDRSPLPDERASAAERARLVRGAAGRFRRTLKGRDRTLFDERWLVDEPHTLSDLGTRFGVSRERARQLEARLLRGLRAQLPGELADAA